MITSEHPDGIYILASATLQQMAEDQTLLGFADSLLPRALTVPGSNVEESWSLAGVLQRTDSVAVGSLLVALLVLDAEIKAQAADETWVWPLPGFLSYCSRLPLDRYTLATVRLPPLNPDGHYLFTVVDKARYLAVRMDIHPQLRVTGHVRVALSGPAKQPQRVVAVEDRLDRQTLDEELIAAAVAAGSKGEPSPLDEIERRVLAAALHRLAATSRL